jgi:hypothetical protein
MVSKKIILVMAIGAIFVIGFVMFIPTNSIPAVPAGTYAQGNYESNGKVSALLVQQSFTVPIGETHIRQIAIATNPSPENHVPHDVGIRLFDAIADGSGYKEDISAAVGAGYWDKYIHYTTYIASSWYVEDVYIPVVPNKKYFLLVVVNMGGENALVPGGCLLTASVSTLNPYNGGVLSLIGGNLDTTSKTYWTIPYGSQADLTFRICFS